MGTCTVTKKRSSANIGSFHAVIADVALSTTYAAGGDTLTIASLGLQTLEALIVPAAGSVLGHVLAPVHGSTVKTDPLIFARDVISGTQVTTGSDFSTEVFRVIAIGEYAGV